MSLMGISPNNQVTLARESSERICLSVSEKGIHLILHSDQKQR
jgi:hypothetical protein